MLRPIRLCVALLLVSALFVSGCSSADKAEKEQKEAEKKAEKEITKDYVLSHMSPELTHRADTHDEARIRHSRTIDVNGRSFWDDLDYVLWLDRPSRLSLFPTP